MQVWKIASLCLKKRKKERKEERKKERKEKRGMKLDVG